MLMPSDIVDYVVHHELIQLLILNHSSEFWKELERSFPDYKNCFNPLNNSELNKIPAWALV